MATRYPQPMTPEESPTESFRELVGNYVQRVNVTSVDLSTRVGRSPPFIRLFTSGHTRDISLDNFCRLSEEMGVCPATFLRRFYKNNRSSN